MKPVLTVALLVAFFACNPLTEAQIPDDLINGMSGTEVSRRIFDGEHQAMEQLKMHSPIAETYIQSLWPDTSAQIPLDDSYFLNKISFLRFLSQQDKAWIPLFGEPGSRDILTDNGSKTTLYAAGFIYVMFVDPWDFDSDTYRLSYIADVKLGTIDCLTFAVTPVKHPAPRRFEGTIWVEKQGLKIVRVQGIFQGKHPKFVQRLSPLGGFATFYLHFDCWRKQIAEGLWVPSSIIVDDNIPWKAIGRDGDTDQHIRARILVWGYSHIGSFQRALMTVSQNNPTTNVELDGLEADGLLAPAGNVEQLLNETIEKVSHSELAALHLPKVTCRVLLTTPLDMFHIQNTILVSRGLLEMASPSILDGLLAHELAHVAMDQTADKPFDYSQSLFTTGSSTGLTGLGIVQDQEEESKAAGITSSLTDDSSVLRSLREAAGFVAQLRGMSHQIPNIAKPQFGASLTEHDLGSNPITTSDQNLALHYRYEVDTWTGQLHAVKRVRPPDDMSSKGVGASFSSPGRN
jgi:hypothetical protein